MSVVETRRPMVGTVHLVSGFQAGVHLIDPAEPGSQEAVTVGRLVGIVMPRSTIIGVATSISEAAGSGGGASCILDLLGEIDRRDPDAPRYRRGVTCYPSLGQEAVALTHGDLELVFGCPGENVIRIGNIHQDPATAANVKVDDLLTKHFAILGSTGVGKSSAVVVVIEEVLRSRPDLRMLFLDPHNEYGSCFAPRAEVLTPKNLRLPFWLFSFEEFVDVLFRGRPGLDDETDILAELIPFAKAMFGGHRVASDRSPLKRNDSKLRGMNADTPVPYHLADLVALIEDRRGKLENRSLVFNYSRLLGRIETVKSDPRYAFMFENASVGGDSMVDVICQLFRFPANGKPMTVLQLAGFPAEVVDSVVSVICRMAFEIGLWSDGTAPMLLLCEEAHRYAPADRSMGFGPTRKALSRIAKEGRKYGVYMGLVTQRPAELDSTIISQCSTVFAMRLANDRDQDILRAAVSDAGANLLSFVPSLGIREAFGFGEGMPLPTRIRFSELPAGSIPRSEAVRSVSFRGEGTDRGYVARVVEKWRGSITRTSTVEDEILAPVSTAVAEPALPKWALTPARDSPSAVAAARAAPVSPKFGTR